MIKSRTAIKIFAVALLGVAIAGCSTTRNSQSERAWTEVLVIGEPGSVFNVIAIGRWATRSFDYEIEGESTQVITVTNKFTPHQGIMISEQTEKGFRFRASPEVRQIQFRRTSGDPEHPLRLLVEKPANLEVDLVSDNQHAMLLCFADNFSVSSDSTNYVADATTIARMQFGNLVLSPLNQ